MKIEIFSILDFNSNNCNDFQMLPLYLDHYRGKFPNCIFNIHLSNYPDDYNGKEIKILKAKDCKISTIELGDNRMYYAELRNNFTSQEEILKSSLAFPEYVRKETDFKNNIWKNSNADWVIICDIDELLQIDEEELKEEKGDIISFIGYQMIRYDKDALFSDLICGHPDPMFNKTSIFKPTIDDINYLTGSHACEPKKDGELIKYDQKPYPYRLLHYKKEAMDMSELVNYKTTLHGIKIPIEVAKKHKYSPFPFVISEKGWWITESKDDPFYEIGDDETLAQEMVKFFKKENIKNIADFGSGNGFFVNYFRDNDFNVDGYEGNPNNPNIVLDLADPISLDKEYDWVISLEVGEHIPKKYEDTFIKNLHNNNKKGLIITWALTDMSGFGHVNCRDVKYITNKFVNLGYKVDEEVTENLRNSCSKFWLSGSLLVLRKK